jgi:energy-coupling factor transporter ATP-binding protein EcfA2
MELNNLEGKIIGVINYDYKELVDSSKLVKEIIINRPLDALKMVKLDETILEQVYNTLSSRDKNKVILASKLQNKVIILSNFTKGLTKKDIEYFKTLFKKIITYNRKIILIDKNTEMFLNCVDNIYVYKNNKVIYETNDIYDNNLSTYCDVPKIVEFTNTTSLYGIRIDHYLEFDELLKAIYRIKS